MPWKYNPFTGTFDYYEYGGKSAFTAKHVAYGDTDGSLTGDAKFTYTGSAMEINNDIILTAGKKLIFDGD